MHSDGIGGVHEDVGHAHQVLNGLQLQTQQVPVERLATDGLWGQLSGALGPQGVSLPSSGPRGSNASLHCPWDS